jgi:ATP-dependent Lon protease
VRFFCSLELHPERPGSEKINPKNVRFSAASNYTREAGVRELERTLGSVCRFVAVTVADNGNDVSAGDQVAMS